MITVKWTTGAGDSGEAQVTGDDKWTFGRADAGDAPSVSSDNARVSRTALVIRDAGPGPVVFRGQRDNGATVQVTDPDGSQVSLDEGTAHNLAAGQNKVELSLDGEVLVSVDVSFDDRGSVVERQQAPGN